MEGVTVLDVQDNGKGFDPSQFFEKTNGHAEGSFGLMGMRQRVEQLGGNLLIESAPGEGTTLVVKLPIPEDGT